MKHLLIIFSLLLTSVSWSEKIDFSELEERGGLYYKKSLSIPYTGDVVGNERGKVVDGKKQGVWEREFSGGYWIEKVNYIDGKKEGKLIYFTEKNPDLVRYILNYTKDKKNGKKFQYNEKGELWEKGQYKNGLRVGIWYRYNYENTKQLTHKSSYKDGKKHGEFLEYFKNGGLWLRTNYKNGKLHGNTIRYFRNGKIESESNYKNGEYHGVSKTYYENGQVEYEWKYKNGKLHGKTTHYKTNGYKDHILNYKYDKQDGNQIFYTGNEELYFISKYKDGEDLYDGETITLFMSCGLNYFKINLRTKSFYYIKDNKWVMQDKNSLIESYSKSDDDEKFKVDYIVDKIGVVTESVKYESGMEFKRILDFNNLEVTFKTIPNSDIEVIEEMFNINETSKCDTSVPSIYSD